MSERRTYQLPLVRYIAAVIVMLVSGWMLLAYNGLRTTEQDRSRGWHIYQPSSHPGTRAVLYLILCVTLALVSAWLMRPQQSDQPAPGNIASALWRNYYFRLCFSLASAFLAAVILGFLSMALTDAGF